MIGKKFNNLTVKSYLGHKYKTHKNYLCMCICGNETEAIYQQLVLGKKKSCGCSRYKDVSLKNKTHGLSNSRIYRIWFSMKKRCDNTLDKNYGGRGITYDKKWDNFEGFYNDMKYGYDDNLTIDRIDTNGNYSKENCRRATYKEQANNRRNNNKITINGITKNITERQNHIGISKSTYFSRKESGMDELDALTNKICERNKKIIFNGDELTLAEWSKKLGIKYSTLYRRVYIKNYPINISLNSSMYNGKIVL